MNLSLKFRIIEKFRTQADFSRAVNTDESKVSRVVQGRRQLTKAEKKKWAKHLKCKVADIF